MSLKMVELCAGTGCFTLAFESTQQVECIYANDMNKHSKKIYETNFPNHPFICKDMNEINVEEIPPHQILTAGFSCQPYSIAGKQLGFNDERSNVFWKILEIMEFHKPEFVILENVKNLVSHNNTKTFTTIKEQLEKCGYNVYHKILNTSEITEIPQHRERVFIICIKSKEIFDKFTLDFPKKEKKQITEILEPFEKIPSKYHYTKTSKIWDVLSGGVIKPNTMYQYRRNHVRENKNNECPTLTANCGTGGHNVPIILDVDNNIIRKITPRECFNFQGFPNSYILPDSIADGNLYKLVGNAVSFPVIQLVAKQILNAFYF
jgi:DNA (cytosine-5)-methyltransferase 1